jgi:hypothetical protein
MPTCSSCCDTNFWLNGEYLLWWFKDSPLPVPLLQTATTNTFSIGPQGGPVILLGNHDIETHDGHSGARFTGGYWLDCDHTFGLEGNYFFLGSRTTNQRVISNSQGGPPSTVIPFINAATGMASSFPLATSDVTTGSALVSLTSRLQGAEANAILHSYCDPGWNVTLLGGFRFLDLNERLVFATASTGIESTDLPGSNNGEIFNRLDNFNTRNLFYGGQIGARANYCCGDWSIGVAGKVAFGDMEEHVTIRGTTITNEFNTTAGGPFTGVATQTVKGIGNFAQPSNVGHRERGRFAVVPEGSLTVAYHLTCHIAFTMGYDFLYLSKVVRPGNQIDGAISTSQTLQNLAAGGTFAEGAHPAFRFHETDFWAQGLTVGVQLRY